MSKQVSSLKGISGNKHFIRMEDDLPLVLAEIAKVSAAHSGTLTHLAKRLEAEATKTTLMRERVLEAANKSAESEEVTINKRVMVEAQALAAERIINEVLSLQPADVAHRVRQMIAKSDNKLLALEQALINI